MQGWRICKTGWTIIRNRWGRSASMLSISCPVSIAGPWTPISRRWRRLCAKRTNPSFMRIGYEFDGEWNAYEPEAYVAAWRRIVEIFRGKKGGEESRRA